MRKTLLTTVALAIAIAFSPLTMLQAAPLANPGAQPQIEKLAQTVAAKKKMAKKKGKKKMAKKGKSKGCSGAYMYSQEGQVHGRPPEEGLKLQACVGGLSPPHMHEHRAVGAAAPTAFFA